MSTDEKTFTPLVLQQIQPLLQNHVLILKFGAPWCKPCKMIAPTVDAWFRNLPPDCNIMFREIDIDEELDLYMVLKKHKMVNGVPTMLSFHGTTRPAWFIPNDSVVGGDLNAVNLFLQRCLLVAKQIKKPN